MASVFDKCEVFEQMVEVAKLNGSYNIYYNIIKSASDIEVEINNEKKVVICSNNYLGLANHPKIKEAAIAAIKKYGTSCTGSRLLNGTLDLHIAAEEKFAKLVGKNSALLFATGYQANLGAISALVGRNDLVFTDRLDHASILDGAILSLGKMIRFRHNDAKHLEELLIKNQEHKGGKLIIVDGVYSMGGDIACLPELMLVAKKYDAALLVDDAHGLGVLGINGAGTTEHFGLTNDTDVIVATASKSLASIGGFVATNSMNVVEYLKFHARSIIYSASLPPANVATILASLDIILTEPQRRTRLQEISCKMRKELNALGFDTMHSETPIIPIFIGESTKAVQAWNLLFDAGIYSSD